MKTVTIKTNSLVYDVLIGTNIFPKLPSYIRRRSKIKNAFVVIDEKVYHLYSKEIVSVLSESFEKVDYCFFSASEKNKSINQLDKILQALSVKNYGRDTILISIGGGITGDIAGFAASIYQRGIPLIHIPTTLLAAVDSSIGGKTGVNFLKKKNTIGSFYQPLMVLIDTSFFKTLPKEEIICGLGEVIKYGLLKDSNFYRLIEKNISKFFENDSKFIEDIVTKSVRIKAQVVEQDEKESSLRKILNLGHTFAHAYESSLNFSIKHGEAVIAGIRAALFLSFIKGFIDELKLQSLISLPMKINLTKDKFKVQNVNNRSRIEKIYTMMAADKKNKDGRVKFVLPAGIGGMYLDIEADKTEVVAALEMTEKTFI